MPWMCPVRERRYNQTLPSPSRGERKPPKTWFSSSYMRSFIVASSPTALLYYFDATTGRRWWHPVPGCHTGACVPNSRSHRLVGFLRKDSGWLSTVRDRAVRIQANHGRHSHLPITEPRLCPFERGHEREHRTPHPFSSLSRGAPRAWPSVGFSTPVRLAWCTSVFPAWHPPHLGHRPEAKLLTRKCQQRVR